MSTFGLLSSSPSSTPQPLAPQLPTSVVFAIVLAFHEYHDVILGTPTLQSGSYVNTHVASTIWVQDQAFGNWQSAWTWVYAIECSVTRKGCAIDLVGQKIRIENISAKTSVQIDKLIKRDWQHLRFDKSEKKIMRDGLSGYVKAGKKNEIRRTNCLLRISKAWDVQQQDRFARLPYPCCNKTFFRRVITVVKLVPTTSRRIIAIKKLNNIMINRLQNPHASVFSDKWRFDSSQDWETLALDFGGCSTDDIADKTL